jgi:hypothetical protein
VRTGIRVTGRRTTFSATANWTERRYEVSIDTQEIIGLTLQASRQMGAGISARADMSWQDVDSTLSGTSQYLSLGVGASRSLGRYSSIGFNLSRQQRTGSSIANEFTEHRIGLTLTTRMF